MGGDASRARHLGDEVGRKLRGAIIAAAQFAEVGGGVGVRVGGQLGVGLALRQQFSRARVGEPLVGEPGDLRELSAALLDAARRHHRLLVPGQESPRRTQERDVPDALDQLCVALAHEKRRSCHHGKKSGMSFDGWPGKLGARFSRKDTTPSATSGDCPSQ